MTSSRSRAHDDHAIRELQMPRAPKPAAAPKAKRTPRRDPKARAAEIYERLATAYPDAHCALDFKTPFQLLIATILSAQCTDKRVNMVTPSLFRRYASPKALAAAKLEELEEMIKSTGFFRNKSRSLVGMAAAIDER